MADDKRRYGPHRHTLETLILLSEERKAQPRALKEALDHLRELQARDDRWRSNYQNAWSALRMIREAIEEFGPTASLESEEATLLRGSEPVHEAEAMVEALGRVRRKLLPLARPYNLTNEAADSIDALRTELAAVKAERDRLREALHDARHKGLIYWEPNTERGYINRAAMLKRIDDILAARAFLPEGRE